jgi:hypothetical protein
MPGTIRLKSLTEAEFLRQVLELAKLRKWRRAHFRPGRTKTGWRTAVQGDGKGFPDVLLIRGCRMVVAELKSATGRVTSEQWDWFWAFQGYGAEAYVWRPDDWDQILKVLE